MQREDIELELLSVKEQMRKVESSDSDVKRSVMEFLLISSYFFENSDLNHVLILEVFVFRCLDEKEKSLKEALRRVLLLEKEVAARDAEVLL